MGSISERSQRLLCWSVYAYRKPDMSEEDYHAYMSEKHGPLVKGLVAKYGMIRFSMVSLILGVGSRSH
jgi:hypothetical protein